MDPGTPRSVDEIFRDFKGRRLGMLKALTTDVSEFVRQCDPDKENLCLYGFPDEAWGVHLPAEEVPPELPEPVLGINFSRDGMARKDWLSLVAVHSDAWLLAVAFFFGARFDKAERKRLFALINNLPTLHDVVTGRKLVKEKVRVNSSATTGRPPAVGKQQRVQEVQQKLAQPHLLPEGALLEDDEDEHENTSCGRCGESYAADEFWICCDICEQWFHGKCVNVTPAKAENIEQYKCPACNNKKTRV